jgi:hypothetical protein
MKALKQPANAIAISQLGRRLLIPCATNQLTTAAPHLVLPFTQREGQQPNVFDR